MMVFEPGRVMMCRLYGVPRAALRAASPEGGERFGAALQRSFVVERRIKQGRIRLPGAALSARLGGQEVTQPYSATRSGGFHALAAGLVGVGLAHALRLLVAHGHLALGLFRRDGFCLQAIVDVVLPRRAF